MSVGVILLVIVVGALAFVMLRKGGAEPAPEPPAAKEPQEKLHWLVITSEGEHQGKAFHIGKRTATVGRDPNNYVQVHDEGASRQQCQLAPEGDSIVVTDMTSSNGTVVNGQVVTRHVLQEGDILGVASTRLRYHRTGDFRENAGLGRKQVGAGARKTTVQISQSEFRRERAKLVLEQAGGDRGAAARTLGITEGELDDILS